jgi:hypothetical protein
MQLGLGVSLQWSDAALLLCIPYLLRRSDARRVKPLYSLGSPNEGLAAEVAVEVFFN